MMWQHRHSSGSRGVVADPRGVGRCRCGLSCTGQTCLTAVQAHTPLSGRGTTVPSEHGTWGTGQEPAVPSFAHTVPLLGAQDAWHAPVASPSHAGATSGYRGGTGSAVPLLTFRTVPLPGTGAGLETAAQLLYT